MGLVPIYLSNLRVVGAADSFPTRRLPFSILLEGNLDLDEFTWEPLPNGHEPYYLRFRGAHVYSASPLATPLVITPLYVIPAWVISHYGISYDDVRARVIMVIMARFSAATMSALSAVILFLVLCRLTTRRWAIALALTYALGTTTWAISSQALWPHALAQLCLAVLCSLFLVPRPSRAGLVAAGLVVSLAVVNRPPMIVFALLALWFVWREHRAQLLSFAALPAIAGALLIGSNLVLYRSFTGGYGISLEQFSGSLWEGVPGLLVSPNRGLLVYTPIMAFAFLGAVRVWRTGVHPWLRYLTIGVALHVLLYGSFTEWWAGYTYGPRYLTDVLPALCLFLVYGWIPFRRRPFVHGLACFLVAYGVAVQIIGVYCADDDWNRRPMPLELRPSRVWDWDDLQIVRAVRSGWQKAELVPLVLDVFRDRVPAKLQPLAASDLAGEIEVANPPAKVKAGSQIETTIRLTNRSEKSWPAFSGEGRISVRYLVLVVARWFDGGRPVPGAGEVLRLPSNLAPGETMSMEVPLTAPSHPGDYAVEVRVTQAIDARRGVTGPDAYTFEVVVD